jgi:MFS family permease
MPAFGALFAPAMALLSEGAYREGLDQGLAFGSANLAWALGQAIAAAGSGALAQATTDLVPYMLLVTACAVTLALVPLGAARKLALGWQQADGQQAVTAISVLRPETSEDNQLVAQRPGATIGGLPDIPVRIDSLSCSF